MELLSLRHLVGDLAVATTIVQFLSGALVCKQYVVNRTTGESTALPFVCCVLSCSLWLIYGVIKADDKLIFVNLVGILLMTGYIIVFYIFTFKKTLVCKQCLVVAVIFFGAILFSTNDFDREYILSTIGILASFFTLASIAAPMVKLFHVIKVKNTECLPFPVILMSFVVSSLWSLYGHIIQDGFIECVNIVGSVLAVAQLLLFIIFPSAPQSPLLPKSIRM